jgi:hypothetical protein
MEIEPNSSHQVPAPPRQLAGWIDLSQPSLCPCGQESLASGGGRHLIGPTCREKIERHIRRRFGAHRYGGRYAAEVPDMIQDCYQKLLGPGGLVSFQLPPGRDAGDAFGAWLWSVLRNYCNNKLHYLQAQPAVGSDDLECVPESRNAITPGQAFARKRICELSKCAVAHVEQNWRAKGVTGGERFDVILPLVYEEDADPQPAYERLGITGGHLRKLKHELRKEIRLESRKQILDGLVLEPEFEPELVELMIDRDIEALLEEAYPGGCPLTSLVTDRQAADEEATDEEVTDEERESKP